MIIIIIIIIVITWLWSMASNIKGGMQGKGIWKQDSEANI